MLETAKETKTAELSFDLSGQLDEIFDNESADVICQTTLGKSDKLTGHDVTEDAFAESMPNLSDIDMLKDHDGVKTEEQQGTFGKPSGEPSCVTHNVSGLHVYLNSFQPPFASHLICKLFLVFSWTRPGEYEQLHLV